jgi:hypothetical protein
MRRVLLTLAIAAASGACSYLNVHRVETARPPVAFPGVGSLLAEPDLSLVSVLVVHGFGRHEPDYADPLRARIREATGLVPRDEGACRDHKIGDVYGSIRVCEYDAATGGRPLRVRVYALLWSPLSAPFKDRYLGFDRTQSDRLALDTWLKNSFMNDRFADAILYLGDFKRHMQRPIEYALCFMLNEPLSRRAVAGPVDPTTACDALVRPEERTARTDRAFVIIAESLGSTMVWETLVRMHDESGAGPERARALGEIAQEVLARTRVFFMLANQLPLLRLATMSKPLGPAEASEPVSARSLPEGVERLLRDTAPRRTPRAPRVEVVAVSDPNDLLGYALPDDLDQGTGEFMRVTNVIHSVAKWGYLFVLAHPLEAHTSYLEDPVVLELLVCGEPASCPKPPPGRT